ncbi:unnamed protein product [Agarophyton chilense]|eukprot:gb/GEZJ01003135.1/.p1 GENE.gb/GEZJ01003135.1/~~gb/GEZJ01003135.1/.p1  ORF type:complete len:301 (-),score=48.74 gb/GEZJ01003135.1/:1133-2035(-)
MHSTRAASARVAFAAPICLFVRPAIRPSSPPCSPNPPAIVCAKRRSNRRRKRAEPPEPPPSEPSVPRSLSNQAQSASPTPTDSPSPRASDASTSPSPFQDGLPVANEARLRLPDLNSTSRRRRRKPLQKPAEQPRQEREVMATDAVQRLTAAYRAGGAEAKKVIDELEKDPDFFLQTGNAKGEYDFASALIGTGRPNRQGIYVLPYLQSGHLLLLGIILLISLIYYPGFPLTEVNEETRNLLKKGLALVGAFNGILAAFAYRAAKVRAQPAAFWALKTAFLGNLAFNELRTNAPIVKDSE